MNCAYCGMPCKGYAAMSTPSGTVLYFHHGDDEWDDDGSPSCYQQYQWYVSRTHPTCPECGWDSEIGHDVGCEHYANAAYDAQGDRRDET